MPTFHKLDRTPTTFPQFDFLAPNLQLLIWSHAIVKPWQASEASYARRNSKSEFYGVPIPPERPGLLGHFKRFSKPCCYECAMVYKSSHTLTGPSSERVIYFHGTTYKDMCLMFDALSMCRMTRLFVSRWWKRKIEHEEIEEAEDTERKRGVLIVLEELIEDVEKRLELV